MDSKQILTADLIDVIFDHRNKLYGAYELRKHYNRRVGRALLITATIVGLTIASVTLANNSESTKQPAAFIDPVKITQIEEPKPIIPEPPVELPPPSQPMKTEAFTTFKVVDDKDYQEPPPSIQDLDSAAIGLTKIEGKPLDEGIVLISNGSIDGEKGIIEKPEPKDEEPRTEVQVQAKYIGNWEKFLLRHLNGNVPVDNGAENGRYQIIIQFVVDIDGTVSDIRPITNIGFGMEQEAIRVLRKATKWEPAIQNGRAVKAYRKQPITFQVNEGE